MLGTSQTNLQEKIVTLLIDNPLSAKGLLSNLKSAGMNYSIQALYDQLRILVKEGVLIKNKSTYSINADWITKIKTLLRIPEIKLSEKQRVTTYCKTLLETDIAWKDLYYKTPKTEHVFFYNPDQLWLFIEDRQESEDLFYSSKKEYTGYYLLGGSYPTHLEFRRAYRTDKFKIEMELLESIKPNMHISVIGDYILSVVLDEDQSQQIHNAISNHDLSHEEIGKQINDIAKVETRHKVIYERNRKKAHMLAKRIGATFLSRKQIEEILAK